MRRSDRPPSRKGRRRAGAGPLGDGSGDVSNGARSGGRCRPINKSKRCMGGDSNESDGKVDEAPDDARRGCGGDRRRGLRVRVRRKRRGQAHALRFQHQELLAASARRLVHGRRDRSAEGHRRRQYRAATDGVHRQAGRRHAQADQAAARLQDRAVGAGAGRAANGLGRQGHAVRRLLVRRRQGLSQSSTKAASARSKPSSRA